MSPFAEIADGQIWYAWNSRPVRDRPPLLLIHGAGGNRLSWPAELRRLAGHSVLVLDLPGHGRSEGPAPESIEAYAAAVVNLLDALKVNKAVVGGHSMGGAIAQTIALEYPNCTAGLVLMGTGPRLRVSPVLLDGILQDFERALALIAKWSFSPAASPDLKQLAIEVMGEAGQAVLHADFQACDRFDARSRLAEIYVPTLVIGGTADKMTPLELSQVLAREIPKAHLETVEGGGHMFALEQPALVAATIARFMSGLS
jgi:pimeloyl-ACP methyl ester carboxylesterase